MYLYYAFPGDFTVTMHLAHPALTTTGRRRGKQKWASAEQKRQHEELAREWQDKLESFKRMSTATKFKPKPNSAEALRPRVPPGRETPRIPSLDSAHKGAVTSKPTQQYTGDAVLGIAIMHKSCLQPVFSQEAAVDSAHMRR